MLLWLRTNSSFQERTTMSKTLCLNVWGDFACFTRPEMKVERVPTTSLHPPLPVPFSRPFYGNRKSAGRYED